MVCPYLITSPIKYQYTPRQNTSGQLHTYYTHITPLFIQYLSNNLSTHSYAANSISHSIRGTSWNCMVCPYLITSPIQYPYTLDRIHQVNYTHITPLFIQYLSNNLSTHSYAANSISHSGPMFMASVLNLY